MRKLTLPLFAVILMGAAAPQKADIDALIREDVRVATIAYRIATLNAAKCPKHGPQTGLLIHSLGQYGANTRPVLQRDFGLTSTPTVEAVVLGSVASKAGLAGGDAIIAINGERLSDDIGVRANYLTTEGALDRLDAALSRGAATLTVLRGQHPESIKLTAVMACPSRIEIVPKDKLDASANGSTVQLTSGIVEVAGDDHELAFVIAHEMAHNILEHRARLKLIGRSSKKVRETELEADRFGLLLMKGAGYDPQAAVRFWARVGRRMDAGIFRDGTHLSPKKRVEFLQSVANALPR